MATAVASRPRLSVPRPADLSPGRRRVLGVVAFVLLVAASAVLRSRALDISFWMDEGLSVGIASHPLTSIPEVLRQDGSPPLYYLLLHVWMQVFGTSEESTHGLSLAFALLTIPVGFWAGRSVFGVRTGWIVAVLCALNPFLTAYGQETRMYALLALEGLLASTLLVHVFVLRRRGWRVPALVVALAALLYTHAWGIFLVGASVLLVAWLALRVVPEAERRPLLRDGALVFGGAGLLFLPWLPTLLDQAAHTAAPWSRRPRFGAPIQISRGLFGGDRSSIALLLAGGAGVAAILARRVGDERQRRAALAFLATAVGTLALAWIASQVQPAWTTRYFGLVLGPLVVLAGAGMARTGRLGLVALAAVAFFWTANPKSYAGYQKSDIQDIAADVGDRLRPGDLVVSAQPEQIPAIAYYLGPRLAYASPDARGRDRNPYVMDWRDALERMRELPPRRFVTDLVASLGPGQKVLLVRPLTEGKDNWNAPWTKLVRRRAAQMGEVLATDPELRRIAAAPEIYRGASTVGNSAVLYEKRR